jgi:hypothetical protein
MSTDSIMSKVWGFCTTLREDGVGYGDYPKDDPETPPVFQLGASSSFC